MNQSEIISIEYNDHKRTISVDFTIDDEWEIESVDHISFMDSVHDMHEDVNDLMDYYKEDVKKGLEKLRKDGLEEWEINARI